MYKKPFNSDLHAQHDVRARNKMKEILKGTPYELRENPDQYGTDLQLFRDGKYYCGIEVEVKAVWKGAEFPYPDVQFLGRKSKQAKGDIVIVLFNADLSHHLVIRGDRLLEKGSNRKLVNKFSNGNAEDFFAVSKDDVFFNYFTKLAERTRK
jgi:hypothetical protein